jgi:hypothetical protein
VLVEGTDIESVGGSESPGKEERRTFIICGAMLAAISQSMTVLASSTKVYCEILIKEKYAWGWRRLLVDIDGGEVGIASPPRPRQGFGAPEKPHAGPGERLIGMYRR